MLVPFVESPEELARVSARVPVGAMVESMAGVRAARTLCERAEFVSIGTNDLAASALRRPRAETRPEDALLPPVWSCIEAIVSAARELGREVSVCGEAATVPEAIERFAEIGVDALSVSPTQWSAVARSVEVR